MARAHCPELVALKTISGVLRRLRKWKLSWKCGRIHLISPDPQYESKLAAIRLIRAAAQEDPDHLRVLFADEASFYGLPHAGRTWHPQGGGGARTTHRFPHGGVEHAPTDRRDARCSRRRVLFQTGSMIGIKALWAFLRRIRRHYGPDLRLVVVWDNWPLHYHPEILRVAGEQRESSSSTHRPARRGPTRSRSSGRSCATMSLRLHRCSGDWKKLRARVDTYLTNLCGSNPALLRYTGLLPA